MRAQALAWARSAVFARGVVNPPDPPACNRLGPGKAGRRRWLGLRPEPVTAAPPSFPASLLLSRDSALMVGPPGRRGWLDYICEYIVLTMPMGGVGP